MPRHGGHPTGDRVWGRVFLAALALAFVAYLGGLWALRGNGAGRRAVLVLATAIQLAPLAAPLLLSTDAWSYWSYARLDDPYSQTPSMDRVSAPYVGTDWLHWTSVYGPAFSLATEPAGATRSAAVAAWTFKVVAALCLVGLACWAARRGAFAAAFVGWNPLLAVHFAGGGHNDAWMIALVAGALALGARGRVQAAGVAWALAAGLKWIPLLLLPLRALEARAVGRRVGHLGFACTVAALAVLATIAYGWDWLDALGPLARNASRETSYALPHRLHVPWPVFAAAYALAYAWLVAQAARGRARLGLAVCLLLVALPYLASWYVVWAVPLAAVEEDRAARLLALALCAYLLPQTILT